MNKKEVEIKNKEKELNKRFEEISKKEKELMNKISVLEEKKNLIKKENYEILKDKYKDDFHLNEKIKKEDNIFNKIIKDLENKIKEKKKRIRITIRNI